MPLPQAVLFDLDGTLIDSAPDIRAALNRLLHRHDRPPVSLGQVRGMIGDGAAALVERAFWATGEPLPPDRADSVVTEYLDLLAAQPALPDSIYPGVPETLARLAADGIRLGLCTNKPEGVTRLVLAQLGLERFFGALAGGDTLPVRKPDGRHLGWVAERLELPARASVMVGDNANDVRAARSLGIPVVVVSYGYPRMPIADLGADRVIDRFDELPAALAGLTPGLGHRGS